MYSMKAVQWRAIANQGTSEEFSRLKNSAGNVLIWHWNQFFSLRSVAGRVLFNGTGGIWIDNKSEVYDFWCTLSISSGFILKRLIDELKDSRIRCPLSENKEQDSYLCPHRYQVASWHPKREQAGITTILWDWSGGHGRTSTNRNREWRRRRSVGSNITQLRQNDSQPLIITNAKTTSFLVFLFHRKQRIVDYGLETGR